jgi:mono/diheme cytochrome c family protein
MGAAIAYYTLFSTAPLQVGTTSRPISISRRPTGRSTPGTPRSVQRRAAAIPVPPLDGQRQVARGRAQFREHCVRCHGAPGVAPQPRGLGHASCVETVVAVTRAAGAGMTMMKSKMQVYVVYPAALFDGWEVVREPEETTAFFDTKAEAILYARNLAVLEGGALIKLENWFGDAEGEFQVSPPKGERTKVMGYEMC